MQNYSICMCFEYLWIKFPFSKICKTWKIGVLRSFKRNHRTSTRRISKNHRIHRTLHLPPGTYCRIVGNFVPGHQGWVAKNESQIWEAADLLVIPKHVPRKFFANDKIVDLSVTRMWHLRRKTTLRLLLRRFALRRFFDARFAKVSPELHLEHLMPPGELCLWCEMVWHANQFNAIQPVQKRQVQQATAEYLVTDSARQQSWRRSLGSCRTFEEVTGRQESSHHWTSHPVCWKCARRAFVFQYGHCSQDVGAFCCCGRRCYCGRNASCR